MTFEIWSIPSSNLVDSFDSEEAAWAALRDRARENGEASLGTLVLAVEDDDGNSRELAAGADLIRRLHATA